MTFEQHIFIVLMGQHIEHPDNPQRAINGAQIQAMAKNAFDIATTYEQLRPKSIIEKGYQRSEQSA